MLSVDSDSPSEGSTPWHWKPPDLGADRQARLRYEPGNWGDLLKDAWVVRIVEACCRPRGATFRIVDPFAGCPHYPLSASSRDRVEQSCTDPLLRARLLDYAEKNNFPSSGRLALDVARAAGSSARLQVYDGDRERLESWRSIQHVEVLDARSGVAALNGAQDADFVLVDPYDLFDQFRALLDVALPLAASRPVLLYLYNKSPRGRGHEEQYRSFRRAVTQGILGAGGAAEALVGSVPSDARLPRAFHEVVLAAPPALLKNLRSELECVTMSLGESIPGQGAFEEIRSTASKE